MQLGKIVMNFCDDNQLREYGPTCAKVCHEIGHVVLGMDRVILTHFSTIQCCFVQGWESFSQR